MSILQYNYVQFCSLTQSTSQAWQYIQLTFWEICISFSKFRFSEPESNFIAIPIHEVQAKHFSSLDIPEGYEAGTEKVNKMGQKYQKEIRTNEIVSFIENEITIKYVQIRVICGEQIYFEDTGPLRFLNPEHALVVYGNPHFLHVTVTFLL